jgi:hypothetical protein
MTGVMLFLNGREVNIHKAFHKVVVETAPKELWEAYFSNVYFILVRS